MNFNAELIQKVRQYELLYNPDHPEYKNLPIRMEIWEKIAKELNRDYKKCRKRWNNLRKFHRRIRIQINASGTLPNMKKRWQFEQLDFIEKYRKKTSGADRAHAALLSMRKSNKVAKVSREPLYLNNNPFDALDDRYLSDSQYFMVMEESSSECDLLPANNFNRDYSNMEQKCPSAFIKISSRRFKSESENPTRKKSVKRRRSSTSFSASPSSSSLSNSCSNYLSRVGAKIDETLLPNVVRYELEKKVADLVYDVLAQYTSEKRESHR